MPFVARTVLCAIFIGFCGGGIFYIARPAAIQSIMLKRMARANEQGSAFVRSPMFLWFLRAVGAVMIIVGLRGLTNLGLLRGWR